MRTASGAVWEEEERGLFWGLLSEEKKEGVMHGAARIENYRSGKDGRKKSAHRRGRSAKEEAPQAQSGH